MARRVVDLHPEAIAEGREARNCYRERSRDVEERFRVGLRRAIREIREAPERWPADDYNLVVAIAHSKRRPGYWKPRLRGPI